MHKPENFKIASCACGFDRSNKNIQHKCEYSAFGMILYWIGISAMPARVNFVCSKCGIVIESTDEPKVLKTFVGR